MNRRNIFALVVVFFTLSSLTKGQDNGDIVIVKQKLVELSIGRMYRPEDYTTMKMSEIFKRYKPGGYWQDINYNDSNPAQWAPGRHWERLFELTYLYRQKNSPYYQNKQLFDEIKNGIAFWLKTRPVSSNYWWNSIGIPLAMGKVLVLLEKDLPPAMLADAVVLMNLGVKPNYYDYHGVATGQNLLWLAYVHLYTSCLSSDEVGIKRAFGAVSNEICVSEAEGIQPDYSFHQHGPQLYSFGYGREFTRSAAQFAYLAQGTSCQFTKEKAAVISHYILDGQQWMTRNGFLEYTAMGREISRGPVGKSSILGGIELMRKIDTSRQAEYDAMYQQLKTGKRDNPLLGNRYFYRSDLMVNQRKSYYFSVKGTSDRIIGSESGNGENLRGVYQGAGTYYLVKRGNEYEGVFPLWNWRQVPGSLCEQDTTTLPLFNWGSGTKGVTSFVYGVSDGLYGCFAYDYQKEHVIAKRAWFCFDREIICMAAGIHFSSTNDLNQNINQCFSSGDIFVNGKVLTEPLVNGRTINRVYQDSVAYILTPSSYEVALQNSVKKGSWREINQSGSANIVTGKVFSLNINLGKKVNNGSLSYAIVPGITKLDAEKYRLGDHVTILRNDDKIQAVYHKQLNQVQAVCYSAGSLQLPWANKRLIFEKPGLVIVYNRENKIFATLNGCLEESVIQTGNSITIR